MYILPAYTAYDLVQANSLLLGARILDLLKRPLCRKIRLSENGLLLNTEESYGDWYQIIIITTESLGPMRGRKNSIPAIQS